MNSRFFDAVDLGLHGEMVEGPSCPPKPSLPPPKSEFSFRLSNLDGLTSPVIVQVSVVRAAILVSVIALRGDILVWRSSALFDEAPLCQDHCLGIPDLPLRDHGLNVGDYGARFGVLLADIAIAGADSMFRSSSRQLER